MLKGQLKEIANAVGGTICQGGESADIAGVSIDTRTINPGEIFVAIDGDSYNGHHFIEQAKKNGAAGAIISEDDSGSDSEWPLIKVRDTTEALGNLGRWWRDKFDLPVVAVTGSNGKTTTKEMIAHLLTPVGDVLKSPFSYNNSIGVPLTLCKMSASHKVAVVEFGTNHFGEIEYLFKIARPTVGLITNIGPSHLEFFGDLKGVAKEKGTLSNMLGADNVAIFNDDDPFSYYFKTESQARIVTFGFDNKPDIKGSSMEVDKTTGGISFYVNEKYHVQLSVGGKYNAYNALAALSVANSLGVGFAEACLLFKSFIPPEHRLHIVSVGRVEIIDDTYNANPLSMDAALEFLTERPSGGRKIAVLGDMYELGEASEKLHRLIGEKAVSYGVDYIFAFGQNAVHIISEARRKGAIPERIRHFAEYDSLIKELREIVREGDHVLVKGSHGMNMMRVVEDLTADLK